MKKSFLKIILVILEVTIVIPEILQQVIQSMFKSNHHIKNKMKFLFGIKKYKLIINKIIKII